MANCIERALLLPKDMASWVEWEDNDLILEIKREAVLVCITLSYNSIFFIPYLHLPDVDTTFRTTWAPVPQRW